MNEELIRDIDDALSHEPPSLTAGFWRDMALSCRAALATPSAPSQGEPQWTAGDGAGATWTVPAGVTLVQPSPQTPAETEDVAQKIARSLEFEPPSLTVGIWRDYAKEAVAIIERQQTRIADYQQQLRGILRRLESVCAEVDVFNAYEARDMVRDLIDGAQPPSAPAEKERG